MQVTLNLTSEQAEMILFSLAMRSKQSKLPPVMAQDAVNLSKQLNSTFEKAFGWTEFDRTASYRKPLKRVTITCYDFPPKEF